MTKWVFAREQKLVSAIPVVQGAQNATLTLKTQPYSERNQRVETSLTLN